MGIILAISGVIVLLLASMVLLGWLGRFLDSCGYYGEPIAPPTLPGVRYED